MDTLWKKMEINTQFLILQIKTKKNQKSAELWDGIKSQIKTIDNKTPSEYGRDSMKIKFYSDDKLPLNKTLKLHTLAVVVRSVFEVYGKYYPQAFLDECLYKKL